MRQNKTYLDNIGLHAIVNVYPQLKKLCLIKEDVTGALQYVHFRDIDTDEIAALRKSISHKSVRDATKAGCLFMLFKPGVGEAEVGGHYDNLVVTEDTLGYETPAEEEQEDVGMEARGGGGGGC